MTKGLVEMLTSDLMMNLKDPPPPGLEAGVVGIIELAVGVAANLPLESRDVYIEYILPGTRLDDSSMKVEGTLPPLTNPGEGYPGQEIERRGSADSNAMGDDDTNGTGPKRGGIFGALTGGGGSAGQNGSGVKSKKEKEDRVRFAAFMSVSLKGKMVLVKAPVYV